MGDQESEYRQPEYNVADDGSPHWLSQFIRSAAERQGFDLCGMTPAVSPEGFGRLQDFVAAQRHGEMAYLADRLATYEHPRHVLDAVRSVVMLTMNYSPAEAFPHAADDPQVAAVPDGARVSRYARGQDYHNVLRRKLNAMADEIRVVRPAALVRGVVDTAPLMERDFAVAAGLGWFGKNTLLLNKWRGSYFFLAALLTDQELEYDRRHDADHCGTCRACLDACPTQAFDAAYQLDARKCISYLTIELRTPIPRELRPGMGQWLFGCDVCQEVCPWNRHTAASSLPAFVQELLPAELDPSELLGLSEHEFRKRFRHTPLWRAKRRGILRNAAIVLGNTAGKHANPAVARRQLRKAVVDAEALVRGAAVWAIGCFGVAEDREWLSQLLPAETDPDVRAEIELVLGAVIASSDAAASVDSLPG